MTVSLLEVLAAARAHAAPLAAESAGYLLLAVADRVVAAPRAVTAEEVELQSDGTVRLRPRQAAAASEPAELGLRRLLGRALEVASSVGPALRRAAERRAPVGLEALVKELEAALIPVNRSAARRALSRLHRETERAREQGKLDAWLRAEISAAQPEALAAAADPPEAAPFDSPEAAPSAPLPALPAVAPAPPAALLPAVVVAAPMLPAASAPTPAPALVASPPLPAEELALTRPEPVIERARERGGTTPKLGTLVTAQTLPGEEGERTERAPAVALLDEEPAADESSLPVEVELDAALEPQPLQEPEPSRLPDVLTAMLELHTGVEADEAPTRLREVVTAPKPTAPSPEVNVHEALTWDPGPVAPSSSQVESAPPSPALLLVEPAPELSPYAPAVLPSRESDVSELLDSFHVSSAVEERELRGALKEMAGLELTPMPHSYAEAAAGRRR